MGSTHRKRLGHIAIILAGAMATTGILRWLVVSALTFTLLVLVPHLETKSAHESQLLLPQELVHIVDQLCVLLSAGMTIPTSLAQVSSAENSRAKKQLKNSVALYELGQDLHSSLNVLIEQDAQWLPLVRMIQRSATTGASLIEQLERYCDFLVSEVHSTTLIRVRRVGVQAVLPLALCFLPAFFVLTIVPIVITIVSSLAW